MDAFSGTFSTPSLVRGSFESKRIVSALTLVFWLDEQDLREFRGHKT